MIKPIDSSSRADSRRVLALLGVLGLAILGWAGKQFADLPSEVNTLKVQRVEDNKRLDRMDRKLDDILKAVK